MDTNTLRWMAAALAGKDPLAYALKTDGSLVVINRVGQKVSFSAEDCKGALLKADKKNAGKPAGKAGQHDQSG